MKKTLIAVASAFVVSSLAFAQNTMGTDSTTNTGGATAPATTTDPNANPGTGTGTTTSPGTMNNGGATTSPQGSMPSTTTGAAAASGDIVDTAMKDGKFTTLEKALTTAGLVETLKGTGPYTVFAPTDAAFSKLPKAQLEKLLADKTMLEKVLKYHVVSGNVGSKDVASLKTADALNGEKLKVQTRGKTVRINDARVTQPDVVASNGVIHVIDRVLIPADVAKNLKK